MGFSLGDLGLAAQAYRGVQDEQKRFRDEQFLQAQRDYLTANQNAEASLRDQRTALAAKQLGLQSAQTDTSMALQPGVQKLALTQQGLAQGAADDDVKNLPMVNATKDQNVHTGLVNAGTAGVQAETARQGAIAEHEDKARQIEHAVASGQVDTDAIRDNMFGHLYADHPDGNFSDSIKRFQFAADKMPLTYPELAGHTIGSVKSETGPDGSPALVVRDNKGKVLLAKSAAQMAAAYNAQGKTQVLTDGSQLVSVNGGRVSTLTENAKTPGAGRGAGAGARAVGGVQGQLIDKLINDAKARGKTLSVEDALHIIKSNPEAAASRMAAADYRLMDPKTTAADRIRIMNEHRAAFNLPPIGGAGPAVDPAVAAQIKAAIGR